MLRLLSALVALLVFTSLQAQTKRYVMPGASGTGASWGDAADLQAAINISVSGDSVFVARGVYQPPGGRSFNMKEGVLIYGGFQGTETALSQRVFGSTGADSSILKGNDSSVIYNNCSSGSPMTSLSVLNGFTIIQGSAASGGGMYNNFASPVISNCIFSKDTTLSSTFSAYGGGMYNNNSSPVISNCVFSDNKAAGNFSGYGGAIYNNNSSPAISACSFLRDTATCNLFSSGGGAIYNASNTGLLIIANCSFLKNAVNASGGSQGGAVYNAGSAIVHIANSIFNQNTVAISSSSSSQGGAVYNAGGATVNITNSLFTENTGSVNSSTSSLGGAIYNQSTLLKISNCTIAKNTADKGAGLYNDYGSNSTVTNSIIYENGSDIYPGDTYATVNYSLVGGWGGGGDNNLNNNISPLFVFTDAANDNFSLRPNSPAIDGGTTDTTGLDVGNTDLAGNPRVYNNARIDMGAYEFQGDPVYVSYIDSNILVKNVPIDVLAPVTIGEAPVSYTIAPGLPGGLAFDNATGSISGTPAALATTEIYTVTALYSDNSTRLATFKLGVVDSSAVKAQYVQFRATYSADAAQVDFNELWVYSNGVNVALNKPGSANSYEYDGWAANGANGVDGNLSDRYSSDRNSPVTSVATPVIYTINLGQIYTVNAIAMLFDGFGTDFSIYESPDSLHWTKYGEGTNVEQWWPSESVALPVALKNFSASLSNGIAQFTWQTGVENNFDHFELQKSTDGKAFVTITSVAAKGSNSGYVYSLPQPEAKAYYRLAIADKDGSSKYSDVVTLSQPAGKNPVQLFPNPAGQYIYVTTAQNGTFKIFTAAGQLVKTKVISAGTTKINIADLVAGVYYGDINNQKIKFIKE